MFGLKDATSALLHLSQYFWFGKLAADEEEPPSCGIHSTPTAPSSQDAAQALSGGGPSITISSFLDSDQDSHTKANGLVPCLSELYQENPSANTAATQRLPPCTSNGTTSIMMPDASIRRQGSNASANTLTTFSLRFHEEDLWSRKSLLSLDGGGVRGYSSLLILKDLMKKIAALEERSGASSSVSPLHERPRSRVQIMSNGRGNAKEANDQQKPLDHYLPCHYFDYVAGTSTGGLISIMLGRLSMTVDECLEAYEVLSDRVFGNPRWFHYRNVLFPRDKYNAKDLEEVICEVIRQRDPGNRSSITLQQPNEDMCRTMVLAWKDMKSTISRQPLIFRSYFHPHMGVSVKERNPEGKTTYDLWKIARATSAAPFYFRAVTLEKDPPQLKVIDGGLGANNPSLEAWNSIRQLNNGDPKTVDIIVSIGTGKAPDATLENAFRRGLISKVSFILGMAKWATDTLATHELVEERSRDHGFQYYRLNVEKGVGELKLDAWEGKRGDQTLKTLRTKTDEYLDYPGVQAKLTRSAEFLVKKRRERSSQTESDHWERYCHGVEYRCKITPCNDPRKKYGERLELRRHILERHSDCEDTDLWLDQGRRFPDEKPPDY